jgi:hypothetical protein
VPDYGVKRYCRGNQLWRQSVSVIIVTAAKTPDGRRDTNCRDSDLARQFRDRNNCRGRQSWLRKPWRSFFLDGETPLRLAGRCRWSFKEPCLLLSQQVQSL